MEALPRLPMIAIELKSCSEDIDFGPVLKKYIQNHYEEDPGSYDKSFSDLNQLRHDVTHLSHDHFGCSMLKKYYSQLQLLRVRFPMGEGGETAVKFTWQDYQTDRKHSISDVQFELACVLYNVGAIHSVLGNMDTRQDADGMKKSCTHYQCAAWAFEQLRDNVGNLGDCFDFSYEYMALHVNIMLAQAQECILEKSMMDSRKNTITCRVAAQVTNFYDLCAKNLNQCNTEHRTLNSKLCKEWRSWCEVKGAFYRCLAHYYMGQHAEEQQKWGERLTYFTSADSKLSETIKCAKNLLSDMHATFTFASDIIVGKYQNALKENDFVYHEKVPLIEDLPEVKGAILVKGIPFDPTDVEISGPDLFRQLLPMKAHEASSLYSEEKATLLRRVLTDIEAADAELDRFMALLNVERSLLDQGPERLPQDLLERCASMSVRTDAVKDLVQSMSVMSGVVTDTEMNVKELRQLITDSRRKLEELKRMSGKNVESAAMSTLFGQYEDHVKRAEHGHQLNTSLLTAMTSHTSNLKMLALPPDELLSRLASARPEKSPENDEVLTEIRRLLAKVDAMKQQREALEKQIRDDVMKDDITTILLATDAPLESTFKDQLKKHDTVINYLAQNLSAQNNIMTALTDTNARFATLRLSLAGQASKREATIRSLITSHDSYDELIGKLQRGRDYFYHLDEAVVKTLRGCRSEYSVLDDEWSKIMMSPGSVGVRTPSRPTAPKPITLSQPSASAAPNAPTTPSLSAVSAAVLPVCDRSMRTDINGAPEPTVLQGVDCPKLKDYLPYLKPLTFPLTSCPPSSLPQLPIMDSAALSSSFPVPRHDVPPAHWSISGVGQLGPSAAHTSGPVFPVPGFPVNVMRPELLRRTLTNVHHPPPAIPAEYEANRGFGGHRLSSQPASLSSVHFQPSEHGSQWISGQHGQEQRLRHLHPVPRQAADVYNPGQPLGGHSYQRHAVPPAYFHYPQQPSVSMCEIPLLPARLQQFQSGNPQHLSGGSILPEVRAPVQCVIDHQPQPPLHLPVHSHPQNCHVLSFTQQTYVNPHSLTMPDVFLEKCDVGGIPVIPPYTQVHVQPGVFPAPFNANHSSAMNCGEGRVAGIDLALRRLVQVHPEHSICNVPDQSLACVSLSAFQSLPSATVNYHTSGVPAVTRNGQEQSSAASLITSMQYRSQLSRLDVGNGTPERGTFLHSVSFHTPVASQTSSYVSVTPAASQSFVALNMYPGPSGVHSSTISQPGQQSMGGQNGGNRLFNEAQVASQTLPSAGFHLQTFQQVMSSVPTCSQIFYQPYARQRQQPPHSNHSATQTFLTPHCIHPPFPQSPLGGQYMTQSQTMTGMGHSTDVPFKNLSTIDGDQQKFNHLSPSSPPPSVNSFVPQRLPLPMPLQIEGKREGDGRGSYFGVQRFSACQPSLPQHISTPVSNTTTTSAIHRSSDSKEPSLDELLSSSLDRTKLASIPAPVISPKVLTEQEKQQQREDALKQGRMVTVVQKHYQSGCVLSKLVSDVDELGRYVDDLSLEISSMDAVWKSVIESPDVDVKKQSMAIARCYPMKNRDSDALPYEQTRVVLSTAKDDYINASWINDLAPSCPKFVATQAPLTITILDFWTMVYELGSEVVVQMTSEYEANAKFPIYYPASEKGETVEYLPIVLELRSVRYRQLWTERNVYLTHTHTKQARTVVHLQFKSWPVSGFPEDVRSVLQFISEVHIFYQQQRSLLKPVIVHCGNGTGRTGCFLMIYTALQELEHGNGLADVTTLARRMLHKRRSILYKKEQLLFCYRALLCYAEDYLLRRKILVQSPHFQQPDRTGRATSGSGGHHRKDDDIVLGSVNLLSMQRSIGMLQVGGRVETAPPQPPPGMAVTESAPAGPADRLTGLPDLVRLDHRSGSVEGRLPSKPETGSSPDCQQGVEPVPFMTAGSYDCPIRPSPDTSADGSEVNREESEECSRLGDLQDPDKFTLGKCKDKKRFSKDDFVVSTNPRTMTIVPTSHPDDPLASLDPLWSLNTPSVDSK